MAAKRGPARKKPIQPAKKVPVHIPGTDPTYTDEELLALPLVVLNPDQRKRKQLIERRQRENIRRAAQAPKRAPGVVPDSRANKPKCTDQKANGDPCGGFQAYGTTHCRWHMTDDELQKAGLKAAKNTTRGGSLLNAPKQLTSKQMHYSAMEQAMAFIINKQFNSIGLEIYGFDPFGYPQVRELPGGGVKLYGESKDGDIVMTNFDNAGVIFDMCMKMIDRFWGKPRQTQVIEGGIRPVQIQPVKTAERSAEVARMLSSIGALPAPHDGRRRASAPSTTKSQESK